MLGTVLGYLDFAFILQDQTSETIKCKLIIKKYKIVCRSLRLNANYPLTKAVVKYLLRTQPWHGSLHTQNYSKILNSPNIFTVIKYQRGWYFGCSEPLIG